MNLFWLRYRYRQMLCGLAGVILALLPAQAASYSLQFPNDLNEHSVGINFVPALHLYPFTVAAWIKAGVQPWDGSQPTPIISKPDASFDGWMLSIFNGNICALYISSYGPGSVPAGASASNGGMNGGYVGDDQWHHVAFTVDASGGKLYVDGMLRAAAPWTGMPGPTAVASPLYLGKSPVAFLSQYAGLLDEVSLWNVALTQAQIQTNRTRTLTGFEPGLVVYYKCDEAVGPVSNDSAQAGGWNHGFWNNMTAVPSNAPVAMLPLVQALPPLAVGPVSAALQGTVNPLGMPASAWFEWGLTTNYGNRTPSVLIGGGTNDYPVLQTLTNLASLTLYHFRAVASNNVGLAFSTNQTFLTAAALPPGVQTLLPSGVFGESATLKGLVDPRGFSTLAWFEWGTTTNYGNVTPPQPISAHSASVPYAWTVTSIPFGSNCHFRAVASNEVGMARGANVLAQPTLFAAGPDISLSTGPEIIPHVTQNEAAIWSHSNTVVVAFNDTRYIAGAPSCAAGIAVSTDYGTTFSRLPYRFSQIGNNSGRPSVFYSAQMAKWVVFFQTGGCNGGIGRWESIDGVTWVPAGCAVPITETDGASTWVDNNPGSPFYGRQYIGYNNFNAPAPLGVVTAAYSTNNGTFWWPRPILGHTSRAGRITGSLGTDGTVFLPILDESGGGSNLARTHLVARSTDGGLNWTAVQVGPPVLCPGRSFNGYWVGVYDAPTAAYWREMGWGQVGVGPGGVVHYAFSAGTASVPYHPNIFYTRSTDNGLSWSAPMQLNSDDTPQRQWNPSIAVNASGVVFVSWYDERKSPGDLEYYGRVSLDNGVTWGVDAPISDAPFRRPYQMDPLVAANFFGYYIVSAFSDDGYGDIGYRAWVDGRVVLNNTYVQQDVFLDRVTLGAELRIVSISRAENGDVILLGTGRPNVSHSVQASSTLAPGGFAKVGAVTPNHFGMWKHNAGPSTPERRFFRMALP